MPRRRKSRKLDQEKIDQIIACNGNLTIKSIAKIFNIHIVTVYAILKKAKKEPVQNNFHRQKRNAYNN